MNKVLIKFDKIKNKLEDRMDASYYVYLKRIKKENEALFTDYFEIIDNGREDIVLPKEFRYCAIGNLTKDSNFVPETVTDVNEGDLIGAGEDSEEESLIKLKKKIRRGDIQSVKTGDILIPTVRVYQGKFFIIEEKNENVYFSNAFIKIRPLEKNAPYKYYLLCRYFLNLYIAYSRWGKSYPTIKASDLMNAKIDKKKTDDFLSKITKEDIRALKTLNNNLVESQEKINKIYKNYNKQ